MDLQCMKTQLDLKGTIQPKGVAGEGMGIDNSLDEVGTGVGPIPECPMAHTWVCALDSSGDGRLYICSFCL